MRISAVVMVVDAVVVIVLLLGCGCGSCCWHKSLSLSSVFSRRAAPDPFCLQGTREEEDE